MTGRALLLCEGEHDSLFLSKLATHIGLADLHIAHLLGKDNKEARMRARLNGLPGGLAPECIAVVADADSSVEDSRKSWQSALANLAPTATRRVFLMPDDASPGMLEDLCLRISLNQPLKDCVNKFVECASSQVADVNRSKVAFDAYQSVVARTQRGVAKAIEHDQLDWNSEHLEPLVRFLRSL